MSPVSARLFRFLLPATAALILCLAPVRTVRAEEIPKPADPDFVFLRTIFDCSPRQALTVNPGFALSIVDSTFGTGIVDGYACSPWSETGPEAFFELTVEAPVILFAALRNLGERDLDLFLLSACDNDSCLVAANIEFDFVLEPGTYTLVVDGYAQPQPQAGDFTLELSAREPGLPEEVCRTALAESCQVGTTELDGDLEGQADQVHTNPCSPVIAASGEQWYAVTVAAYHEFTATLSNIPASLDPILWLFPACSPDAECMIWADAKTAGQAESLTWANNDFNDATVYLGVDAALLPVTGEGTYSLELRCQTMVPAEQKSFGSIKATYR